MISNKKFQLNSLSQVFEMNRECNNTAIIFVNMNESIEIITYKELYNNLETVNIYIISFEKVHNLS